MNDAAFSPCGEYRFWLSRELTGGPIKRRIAWIMLNPSTADCTVNDPTIKQIMAFSMKWGYGAAEVVNLFAYRATDPRALRIRPDPIGLNNTWWMLRTAGRSQCIMAAWGADAMGRKRALELKPALECFDLKCLGVNKDGSPWHPLYRPRHLTPQPWSFPVAT